MQTFGFPGQAKQKASVQGLKIHVEVAESKTYPVIQVIHVVALVHVTQGELQGEH